ncbi:MAG TPA: ABC transporter ATP-binding protein [Actinomycetes bacterium]|nr:ABC transporter ATP-binding protein [Actinomycetes bacterium]
MTPPSTTAQRDRLSVHGRIHGDSRTRLEIDLSVREAGVIGVVGPNGAGKSTLLRTIAGLEAVDGRIAIDGHDVTDSAPAVRRVAYVPQRGALFPHLTVRDNVAYGLRARRVPRSTARARADEQLDRLEIAHLADRRPLTLSGGQAQRVAVARALVVEPKVILLDEPTAALDAASRTDVRAVLHRHLDDFDGVTLLVTHEASEVLTLARRVLVLDEGRVVQDASTETLIARPASHWLAHLLNLNGWTGVVARDGEVALDAGGWLQAVELPAVGSHIFVTASPTSITLYTEPPSGSARNLWAAVVDDVSILGDRVRVTLVADPERSGPGPRRAVAEITRQAVSQLDVRRGTSLFAAVKATDLTISPL